MASGIPWHIARNVDAISNEIDCNSSDSACVFVCVFYQEHGHSDGVSACSYTWYDAVCWRGFTETFEQFDADSSGAIDWQEFDKIMRAFDRKSSLCTSQTVRL
jgi:hypothetical protein